MNPKRLTWLSLVLVALFCLWEPGRIFSPIVSISEQEEDMQEIVLLDSFTKGETPETLLFITVNGKDPTPPFLSKLLKHNAQIRNGSQAIMRDKRYVDKVSGATGIKLGVGKVRWIDAESAEVFTQDHIVFDVAGGSLYTVVWERGQWKIKKRTTNWAS